MRILMLAWEFPPNGVGGLAQHVFELSRALVAAGNTVHVITTGNGRQPQNESIENINVWRVIPYDWGADRSFIDWVYRLNFALAERGTVLCSANGRYDLIHAHDWMVAPAARLLKHAYRMPLLATIHATEFGRHGGLHTDEQRQISQVEWWLTYESWKVICCSQYMRSEVKSVFQLPDDKIVVIPNGIRSEAYRLETEQLSLEELGIEQEDRVIFFVGRLVPEKGVQVILEAAPAILEQFPKTKFVIAGKGPFEEHLKTRALQLDLKERVVFAGYIDDSLRNTLYKAASVAVFPSIYEPFGIVALEAMVSETPVIVSSVGGLDEIVKHEIDGLKVYPDDSSSLAFQVIRLLSDESWAHSLAMNAYQKAVNEYSWEHIARVTSGVYRDIIISPENTRWQQEMQQDPLLKEVTVKGGQNKPFIPYFV